MGRLLLPLLFHCMITASLIKSTTSLLLLTRCSCALTLRSLTVRTISKMSSNIETADDAQFGKFAIPAASVFYRSPANTLAFVNLRPIVLGHVLLIPSRVVALMQDLTEAEYLDLWSTVRIIQGMLQQEYNATAFNVAVQDGRAAGQSVPHVHIHILPRAQGDFERNDQVYDELHEWAPRPTVQTQQGKLDVPDDQDRRDRTREEMAQEAATYRNVLEKTK